MMCDQCQQRQATVMVTRIVNGKKSEAHLCQECAQQHGDLGFLAEPSFTFHNILAGLFEPEGMVSGVAQTKPNTRCPNCGLSFSDFRRLGHLGCSECYTQFETLLDPLVKRIHGSGEHVGKIPMQGGTAKLHRELDNARRQLREAVASEAYEKAAELRDRIKDLEKQIGS